MTVDPKREAYEAILKQAKNVNLKDEQRSAKMALRERLTAIIKKLWPW